MKIFWWILFVLFIQEFKVESIGKKYQSLEKPHYHRDKRNAIENFPEVHSKLTLAARIFAGISIRVQLLDGSLARDDLLSELLDLSETINLDDVENFKRTEVENFVRDLLNVDVSESDKVKKFEERIGILEGWIKRFKEIPSPTNSSSMNDYISKADSLAKSTIVTTFFTGLSDEIRDSLKYIKQFNDRATSTDNSTFAKDFYRLWQDLKSIAKVPTKMSKLFGDLEGYKDLLEDDVLETSTFLLIQLADEFMTSNANSAGDDPNVRQSLLTLFVNLGAENTKLTSISSTLSTMEKLMTTTGIKTRQFAPGLVNGFKDLKNLTADAKDPWLSKSIPEYKSDLIGKELAPLKSLGEAVGAFRDKVPIYQTPRNAEILEAIFKIRQSLPSTSNATVDWLTNVSNPTNPPPTDSSFKTAAVQVTNDVKTLRTFISTVFSKLKMITELDEFKNFEELCGFHKSINFTSDTALHESQLDGVIAKMEKFEKLDELKAALTALKPKFAELEDLLKSNALKNSAAPVSNAGQVLTTFHSNAETGKLINYFTELSTLSPQIHDSAKAVETVHLVRETKKDSNFQLSFSEMASKFEDLKARAKNMNDVLATIKTNMTPAAESLKKLADFPNKSKVFGESVAVLHTVHEILGEKANIQKLLTEGLTVPGAIDSSTNTPEKKAELTSKWGDFTKLSTFLTQLLTLEQGTRRKRETASLKDLVGKLGPLQNLPNLNEDLKPKIEVAKTLGLPIQGTLEKLDSLDLQFSAHSGALTRVDQDTTTMTDLLSHVQATITATTSPTATGQTASSRGVPKTTSAPKAAKEAAGYLGYIGGGVGAVVVLGVLGGIGFLIYRKKKSPKHQPLTEHDAPPGPPGDGSNDSKDSKESTEDKAVHTQPTQPTQPTLPILEVDKTQKSTYSLMEEVDAVDENPDKDASTKTAKPKEEVVVPEKPKFDEKLAGPLLDMYWVRMEYDRTKMLDGDEAVVYVFKTKSYSHLEPEEAAARREEARKRREELEEEMRTSKARVERKLETLKKAISDEEYKLDNKTVKLIKEFAKQEYDKNLELLETAKARLQKHEEIEVEKSCNKKFNLFNAHVETPLAMCRKKPQWTLEKDFWVPPKCTRKYCEMVFEMLIKYTVQPSVVERNLDVSMILAPYQEHLDHAYKLVDALKLPFKEKYLKFNEHCYLNRPPVCYDVSTAKLSTGEDVDATFFDLPYGRKIWIAGQKSSSLALMDQLIWDQSPAITVTCGNDAVLYYKAPTCDRPKVPKFHFKNGKTLANNGHELTVAEMEIVCGKESRKVINVHIGGISVHDVPTSRQFPMAVRYIMDNYGRLDKNMIFMDKTGSYPASSLAGSFAIRAWLSQDGVTAVDVTTLLYRMLQRRGNCIAGAHQAMFMICMGVDLFLRDHDVDADVFADYHYAADVRADKRAKKERFGEEMAKRLQFDCLDTVDGLDNDFIMDREKDPVPKYDPEKVEPAVPLKVPADAPPHLESKDPWEKPRAPVKPVQMDKETKLKMLDEELRKAKEHEERERAKSNESVRRI